MPDDKGPRNVRPIKPPRIDATPGAGTERAIDIGERREKKLINAMYIKGSTYLQRMEPEEAFKILTEVLQKDPKHTGALIDIGRIYFANGEDAKAEESFQKAIESDPYNGRAYYEMGFLKQQQSYTKEAIEYYTKAIEQEPPYIGAFFDLAFMYLDDFKTITREDIEKAEIIYKKYLNLRNRNIPKNEEERAKSLLMRIEAAQRLITNRNKVKDIADYRNKN